MSKEFRTSVGGQALMEGIMMRGPEKICCAVRKPDGTTDLTYDTLPSTGTTGSRWCAVSATWPKTCTRATGI